MRHYDLAMKRLVVHSYWEAQKFDPGVPYIVISITNPPPFGRTESLPLRPMLVSVLNLQFVDVSDATHPQAMQPSHARAIWEFLANHPDVDVVMLHCMAGAGRSPSVALAIADAMGWPRSCVEWMTVGDPLVPNELVYDLVRRPDITGKEADLLITRFDCAGWNR